jgi:hypothetical protein
VKDSGIFDNLHIEITDNTCPQKHMHKKLNGRFISKNLINQTLSFIFNLKRKPIKIKFTGNPISKSPEIWNFDSSIPC